jgi:hypothetical protein
MKRRWLYVFGAPSLAALLSAVPLPGQAAKPKKEAPAQPAVVSTVPKTQSLGTVGSWSAYASGEKSSRICYLVGRPQKTDSARIDRKPPVAMVTHRPSENIANVVSFVEGYPLKSGTDVALEVDDKKFDMFTNDDSAWARTAELDRTIVSAFIEGRSATVKGTPGSGKPTTDVYSLSGFSKALALIDQACGISRPETAAATQPTPAEQKAVPQTVSAPAKAATTSKKGSTRKASHRKASKQTSKKKSTQAAQ